ncbi:MAG: hypothetical protein R3322_03715 [Kiloniellales bacterium]|jgi:hypothetical protein|nr:hypothetical protein [Kiloniellales bacterium]
MTKTDPSPRFPAIFAPAILAPVILGLALAGCGPQIVDGDENAVFIKAGPTTSLGDVEGAAKSYCERYDKFAHLEGGDQVDTGTLHTTYRFDCVDTLL